MSRKNKIVSKTSPRRVVLREVVEEIMENSLEARNDDSVLYAMVCEKMNEDVKRYSFSDVLRNRVYFGLPTYETIRLTRCKVVSLRKELDCLPGVRRRGGNNYMPYLDYAKI